MGHLVIGGSFRTAGFSGFFPIGYFRYSRAKDKAMERTSPPIRGRVLETSAYNNSYGNLAEYNVVVADERGARFLYVFEGRLPSKRAMSAFSKGDEVRDLPTRVGEFRRTVSIRVKSIHNLT